MNDDELRALIRAAVQRHIAAAGPQVTAEARVSPPLASIQAGSAAISFAQYQLARSDGDSMCIIEPAVQCNHCGFCKCHGH